MPRIAMVLLLVVSWPASGQQELGISDVLQAAIKKFSPTARVLQAGEINMEECEAVPKTPGLVRADFNGDGLEDAAVLLVTHVASEIKIYEGRKYQKATL